MHEGKTEMTTLSMQRTFDVPAAALFAAWQDPKLLERWIWGSLGQQTSANVDFRAGGQFRVTTARPDGATWALSGEYTEISDEKSLLCTLAWDAPMGYEPAPEKLRVEFVPIGDGTEMHFWHYGIPTRDAAVGHEKGWHNAFETLRGVVGGA